MNKRTHDLLYLDENRYEDVKDGFKFCASLLKNAGGFKAGHIVCDVGCAAGEYLYYLTKTFPSVTFRGYDLLPALVEKARIKVPQTSFFVGSVNDPSLMPSNSADACFLIGVHSIFEEFEPTFSNLISWVKPGGRCYIFGIFNAYPVDVYIKYRASERSGKGPFEAGWNMFSMKSITRFLDQHPAVSGHTFHKFTISVDLQPNPADPVRSWTFKNAESHRLITNGLSIIQQQYALEIIKR